MKRLTILLALLLSTAVSAATVNVNATLTWTAVTTSTSGGALGGPTSYNVWDGNIAAGGTCSASSMKQVATGLTALTDTIALTSMTPGTIECFAVSATAGGQTGALSNIAPYTIPAAVNPTPGVTTLTVTVVVPSP
jgi:hypothetical protein